jgi:sulfur carrier protein ThiS
MKTVKLKINGLPVEVPEGTNLLNAAKQVQVKIPACATTRTCRRGPRAASAW